MNGYRRLSFAELELHVLQDGEGGGCWDGHQVIHVTTTHHSLEYPQLIPG